jgi:ribosomal protein L11 methyltransferase
MSEFYYELVVKPEEKLEFFSSVLLEITSDAIEERDGSIIVRSEDSLEDIAWVIEQTAKKLAINVEITLEKKKNEDWINKYKTSIKPVQIASFYIRPEWVEPKENLTNIIINPALAFGSGHHESTSSCIELIDRYVKKDDRVLDVGTGSGILGICASKKGAKVDICDTDELAVESAKENFLLNLSAYEDAWVGSANKTTKKYDIVIANIIADIIIMINQDLRKAVDERGYLILSGIIDKYFDKVKEKFSDFDLVEHIEKGEWHTLMLKKRE